MSATIRVRVGSVLQARNTNYRVDRITGADEVIAINLETHQREILKVAEFSVVQSKNQRTHGRPNARSVSNEKWERAEKQYKVIEKLVTREVRTLDDVKQAAKKLNCSVATVYRRIQDAQTLESPVAMLRRTRLESPSLGFDVLPQGTTPKNLEQVVVHIARDKVQANSRCSALKFCSDVIEKCEHLSLHKPHTNTVRNVLNRLEPGIRIAILKGRKASLKLEGVPGTFADSKIPFHTFQIDHTKLNVMVVDPKTRKSIGRAWITLVIETYSRVVPGFAVALHAPSVESISEAIRRSILPKDDWLQDLGLQMKWPVVGKPVTIHADNAKEFRGYVLRRVCRDHGMDLVWRPCKKPRWGAFIERLAGTLSTMLRDVAGATYSSPLERMEYDSEGHAIMTLDELEKWLAYRIGVVYHNTPNTGIEDKNDQKPLERLQRAILGTPEHPGIGLPPLVADPRRFFIDFLPRKSYTIQPNGVKFEGVRYFDDCLRPFIGEKDPLHPNKNRKWEFARDNRDISPIYFYDPQADDYQEIPFADLSRPHISKWELKAARAIAQKDERGESEDAIFSAVAEMRKIEETSAADTKAVRRAAEAARRREKAKDTDRAQPKKADTAPLPTLTTVPTIAPSEPSAPRVRRIFTVERT